MCSISACLGFNRYSKQLSNFNGVFICDLGVVGFYEKDLKNLVCLTELHVLRALSVFSSFRGKNLLFCLPHSDLGLPLLSSLSKPTS